MLNSLYFQSERLWIQWDEKTFCTLHVTCSRDGGSDSIWDFHLKFLLNQHFSINFLHSQKGVKRLSFEFRHPYRGSTQLITQIANFKEMQSRVDTCNYESVWWFRLWDCFCYSLLIPIKKGLWIAVTDIHTRISNDFCVRIMINVTTNIPCVNSTSRCAWVRQND